MSEVSESDHKKLVGLAKYLIGMVKRIRAEEAEKLKVDCEKAAN